MKEFVFTPVPFTAVSPIPDCPVKCSSALATDDHGQLYAADQVWLTVEASKSTQLVRWAESFGFDVLSNDEGLGGVRSMLIRVPPGAAPDAVKLFKGRSGVRDATLNPYYTADERARTP